MMDLYYSGSYFESLLLDWSYWSTVRINVLEGEMRNEIEPPDFRRKQANVRKRA
jgi:hypothetical protein